MLSAEQDMREGRFQRQVAMVTGISALLSGFEAYYSHYKNNFRYWVQWTPVVLAPVLAGTAFTSIKSRRVATIALPAVSALAGADAAVGFYYHARGVLRRPGGSKRLLYNIMYGPPILLPCSSARPGCWACSPACCGGGAHEKRLSSSRCGLVSARSENR